MDIPWNPKVPGTMGWVGQFLAFPDIYGVNLHSLLHLYKTYLASPLKLCIDYALIQNLLPAYTHENGY